MQLPAFGGLPPAGEAGDDVGARALVLLEGEDVLALARGVVEDAGAAEAGADDGAEEGEFAYAGVPAAFLLEDDGVCG